MRRVHTCCFSSLDDLPKRLHSDKIAVLDALRNAGRFSSFEVTPKLGTMIKWLEETGLIKTNPHKYGYPWVSVIVVSDELPP